MFNSPHSTCYNCLLQIIKNEGISALYRSYTTQLTMNIPFHAIHIVVYEKVQQSFNSKREYNPMVHMFAGALAGGAASALTTPLDMAKTVLNIQETSTLTRLKENKIKGLFHAIKTIYTMQGLPGFFRGMQARVLYQMPGTAISWSVYELFKYQLSKTNLKDDSDPECSELLKDNVMAIHKIDDGKPPNSAGSEDSYSLETATNKTVERLKQLHMPSHMTASCTPINENSLKNPVGGSNRC